MIGIGIPTDAYATPPDGEEMGVSKNGKTTKWIYKSKPAQMVCAIKMRFKEKTINILNVEKPVKTTKIYSVIYKESNIFGLRAVEE